MSWPLTPTPEVLMAEVAPALRSKRNADIRNIAALGLIAWANDIYRRDYQEQSLGLKFNLMSTNSVNRSPFGHAVKDKLVTHPTATDYLTRTERGAVYGREQAVAEIGEYLKSNDRHTRNFAAETIVALSRGYQSSNADLERERKRREEVPYRPINWTKRTVDSYSIRIPMGPCVDIVKDKLKEIVIAFEKGRVDTHSLAGWVAEERKKMNKEVDNAAAWARVARIGYETSEPQVA